ncbi:MAG: hypothetical protein JSS78_03590 [Bacteroidetes bacterium]|nr:hypothetical protein [Bacteroidota bacterium]
MFKNQISYRLFVSAAAMLGTVLSAQAMPTVGSVKKKELLRTAAGCDPATASIELDINNVRARLMTGGDMWWNQGTNSAAYEIPKGSKKNSLFAGSVWVGGFTADKQLKVCAQTYRIDGNDYWPGPLRRTSSGAMVTDKAQCSDWDRFWKVDRATISRFREFARNNNLAAAQTSDFQSIWEWPAYGNGIGGTMNQNSYSRAKGTSGLPLNMDDNHSSGYAPFVNNPQDPLNNPDIYEPERGDFPGDVAIGDLLGDQYIWWVFNDVGNTKGQTKTESIGMEVQTGAFAFSSKDFMNDATFYNYRLINWGTSNLDSTFMATWTDADLGYAFDDYIGCDTIRGLGILYNGTNFDGHGEANSYGADIPMIGVDFFRGPHKYFYNQGVLVKDSVLKMTAFTYFNNGDDQRIGDPRNGVQVYNYITGTSRNGQTFNNDFQGPGVKTTALGPGPKTSYVFFGDPDKNEWSECNCGNPPFDRRFIHSAGPFVLYPGNVNDITIGAVWVASVGGCPVTSFKKIRLADDVAQSLFDNGFKTIEGPEAPLLVKREMDNKIIFYLQNPTYSTNFQEKFGYQKDSAKYRVKALKAINQHSPDSLYQFEGYIVYQLKNNQISLGQIFNERGELNTDVAQIVFQCDLKNGRTQIVNWAKNINITNCPDTCWDPQIKVNGRDSGIVHSFSVTKDMFATGLNQNLVNYKNYYYVAIAYAYNNFANFDPRHQETTQDVVYLESAHGPGGSPIQIIEAMPNPFSHQVGTQINSDFGDGVVIRKLEGIGNGGNFLEMSDSSVLEALSPTTGYQSSKPVYMAGKGPVNLKVVDPLKVVSGTWSIYVSPDTRQPAPYTRIGANYDQMVTENLIANKTRWTLVRNGQDTVYSEMNIDNLNEQIIANYGISIAMQQQVLPGEDESNGDGLLTQQGVSASSQIVFANPTLTWLGGVNDGQQTSPQNWIRGGMYVYQSQPGQPTPPCNYNSVTLKYTRDSLSFYENLLPAYSFTRGTWAPYVLGAFDNGAGCDFGVIRDENNRIPTLRSLYGVDIVFTPDTSKWSRCVVVETNNGGLGEGGVQKLDIRSHQSWNKQYDNSGNPVYSTVSKDTGFSWFPGYAINIETGQRLNIIFGEDSYLTASNGRDMLWNPTNVLIDAGGNNVWGGRHFVYVSSTKYDGCDSLSKVMASTNIPKKNSAYQSFMWMGLPMTNVGFAMRSLKDGLIPTVTTLKFRITRPYARYIAPGVDTMAMYSNKGFPWYQFSTNSLATKDLSDANNKYYNDKQALLDKMFVVPNPYYANSPGYEINRLDTRVRIVGLPTKATIMIYSLDGSLIRKLDKDNNVSFLDWDIRNAKGLPIASGMYLVHINAQGIGEKIIRWFGAMRPIDITQY